MIQLKRLNSDFMVFIFFFFFLASVCVIGRSPHPRRPSDPTPNIKDNDTIGEVLGMQISLTVEYMPTDCMNQLKRMNCESPLFVFLSFLFTDCC